MPRPLVKSKVIPLRVSPETYELLKAEADRLAVTVSSLLLGPWEGDSAVARSLGMPPGVPVDRPASPSDDDVASAEAAFRAFVGPDPLAEDLELSRVRLLSRAENHRLIGAELARREGAPPSVTSDAEGRRLARQSERGEDFVGGLDAAREKSVAGYAREVERVEAKPLVASVLPVAGTAFPKKDALKRSGKGK